MERDFEQFFKANERRIHFQIHRLGIFGSWYDEFFSEGVIALWQAYKDFDESKGADVGTFINYRIRFRLVDLLRKKLRDQEVVERSEEHTSELQSRGHLVCRLLLEKKKEKKGKVDAKRT